MPPVRELFAGVISHQVANGSNIARHASRFMIARTDNAIYPTLFLEYASSAMGWSKDEFGGLTRFFSIAIITILLAMLNYTGLEIVGNDDHRCSPGGSISMVPNARIDREWIVRTLR